MLTKVGDDIFADNTIRNLESWGINTTYVEKVPCTSSGVAPIFVNANSSNSILIIKGANKFLSPEDIDRAAEDLKNVSLLSCNWKCSWKPFITRLNLAKTRY